jgi:hypothetical protein
MPLAASLELTSIMQDSKRVRNNESSRRTKLAGLASRLKTRKWHFKVA